MEVAKVYVTYQKHDTGEVVNGVAAVRVPHELGPSMHAVATAVLSCGATDLDMILAVEFERPDQPMIEPYDEQDFMDLFSSLTKLSEELDNDTL